MYRPGGGGRCSKGLSGDFGRGEPFAFYSRPYSLAPKNAWESTLNPLDDFQFNEILEKTVLYREHPFLDTSRDGLAPRQPSSRHLGAISSRGANNPNRASPTKPLFERARINQ